ncbi:tripartite tricarboxylate transporter substrate binding protein [Bradyrhizobium sp. SSUT77]|uniref:tripartite tricarboxylate transporter substrate binding protein n=1 Tax=Bradyrhizobium sp. SSUT77 TaxID=3040603 RepID=UPI00244A2DCA|nr:tripartite tricarboxylate transporter substrate binding protein [Bradyrhizobium sp. SSUT77]MDH2347481.1 tripartite tricarboxylate transporter substrate binding protein [Bradyrhizobium sp. SSUT77]
MPGTFARIQSLTTFSRQEAAFAHREQNRMEFGMTIGKIISHQGDRKSRGKGLAVRRCLDMTVRAFAALSLVAGLVVAPARAEYPEKIIKIVVPLRRRWRHRHRCANAGTGNLVRPGKPVIIENKPGAGTIIGTQSVATSEPDGYSLLVATFAHAVNPSLNNKLPFDPHKDFAAVSLIARSFNIVVVNPASKIRSISDLIAEAKAKPEKLNFGTFGIGTSAHLAGELFNSLAKVKMTAVPYKGAAPAISDLLGGQIDVMFTTVASAAPLVAAGQLRALAVTSAERSPAFPELLTVAEAGVPGYTAEGWYGLYAPARTPASVVERLNKAVAKAIQSGAFKRLETNEGLIMVGRSPEELDRYVQQEEERWHRLIKDANIEVQ